MSNATLWIFAGILLLGLGFGLGHKQNRVGFAIMGFGAFVICLFMASTYDPVTNYQPEAIPWIVVAIMVMTGWSAIRWFWKQNKRERSQEQAATYGRHHSN